MHLHACSGSPHRPPLRPHRIDARKFRHRLLGDRAGGDAGRIVFRPRCQHSRCRPVDHLRRRGAVFRFAGHGVADQPDRAAHAADLDAGGIRHHQCRLRLRAELHEPAGAAPADAGDRRAVHAAGGGHRGPDRSAGKTRQHHRLHLSRLVAGRGRRPAADHLHRQPLWVSRGVWRYRGDRVFKFSAAGVAAARRVAGRAGGPEDLGPVSAATG